MITIAENYSLLPHNSFKLPVTTRKWVLFTDDAEINGWLKDHPLQNPYLVLGGGSNILFTQNFNGTILYPANNSIDMITDTPDYVILEAGAGCVWDDLVDYTVKNNWGGLENLSLIPGHVGAAPVQNIGAYGAEAKDSIYQVTYINLQSGETCILNNAGCQFAYRSSIFKTELANEALITKVQFKLTKNAEINASYADVARLLENKHIGKPTITDMRSAIIEIRMRKLPDPKVIGNAGSFFKNPEISYPHFDVLLQQYPAIPHYRLPQNVKIPAAWLIETCGLKGFTMDAAGVYPYHALVLVNNGNATGSQIAQLAAHIQQNVYNLFKINLHPEVIIL